MLRIEEVGALTYAVDDERLEIWMEQRYKNAYTGCMLLFALIPMWGIWNGIPPWPFLVFLIAWWTVALSHAVGIQVHRRHLLVFDKRTYCFKCGRKVISSLLPVTGVRIVRVPGNDSDDTYEVWLEADRLVDVEPPGPSLSQHEAAVLAREIAAFLRVPLTEP